MRFNKYKKLKYIVLVIAVGVAGTLGGTVVKPGISFATPVPAVCQTPGTAKSQSSVCAAIPIGCPGTSLQGPVLTQPTNCPYTAASNGPAATTPASSGPQCGSGKNAVKTAIDIGCKGSSCPVSTTNPDGCSALLDATFAIIRVLSDGVGLVFVGSIVYAGILYTASAGDPKASAKAIGRIRSSIIALVVFIFGYAILNYVIPAGFFN